MMAHQYLFITQKPQVSITLELRPPNTHIYIYTHTHTHDIKRLISPHPTHNVTTWLVYDREGLPKKLARPKSVIFRIPFDEMSRFPGLRSCKKWGERDSGTRKE